MMSLKYKSDLLLKEGLDLVTKSEAISFLDDLVYESKFIIDVLDFDLLLTLYRKWEAHLFHFHNYQYTADPFDNRPTTSEYFDLLKSIKRKIEQDDSAAQEDLKLLYPHLKKALYRSNNLDLIQLGLDYTRFFGDDEFLKMIFEIVIPENYEVAEVITKYLVDKVEHALNDNLIIEYERLMNEGLFVELCNCFVRVTDILFKRVPSNSVGMAMIKTAYGNKVYIPDEALYVQSSESEIRAI
jgi:hypothetical protein